MARDESIPGLAAFSIYAFPVESRTTSGFVVGDPSGWITPSNVARPFTFGAPPSTVNCDTSPARVAHSPILNWTSWQPADAPGGRSSAGMNGASPLNISCGKSMSPAVLIQPPAGLLEL